VDLLDLDLIIATMLLILVVTTLPMDIQAVVLNLVIIVLRISLLATRDLPLPVLPVLLLDLIIA
jgi:hypothetical protein